ncbi:hypothetical protein GCK72_019548 [Caenorhabditis remanei]|uniref:Uncharacterized protein n=1 Tax=Caenorhabditis remanei TaxID=31234 RepID=A0A6A5GE87_CAERE|nr:hypothetical protein GCK72_019548 [Caenorhabditis remanei]KAF1752993.1 hypothetical protein GCK72_019548 [Caenorhabditis remanei]
MSNEFDLSDFSITEQSEYRRFKFQFNWLFFYVLGMACYSVLPIFIYFKILFFILTEKKTVKRSIMRAEIFDSFLYMQFWNIVLIIADFSMIRIPYTTFFTKYFATENPQVLMKFIVFLYFWATYASQLFTLLFCALRVSILYAVPETTTETINKYVPPIIVTSTLFAALPHLSSEILCLQLTEPYSYGSFLIISVLHATNKIVLVSNLSFYITVAMILIVLNMLMLLKIRRNKSMNAFQSTTKSAKVERTLTVTMIILLFPMIFGYLVSIGEIFRIPQFSYVLLFRALVQDFRVHIVTCYFYSTNPVFKATSPQSSVIHVSHVSRLT